MKKSVIFLTAALLLSALPSLSQAQDKKLPQRYEIAEVNPDNDDVTAEVFYMVRDEQRTYYLSVGQLGVGNKVVQINIDPLNELFLPLGNTLDEAIETLGQLKALVKQPKGSSIEMDGCLHWAFPGKDMEKVTVTHVKPLLTHQLEFSVRREDHIRCTYISKSDIGSLLSSVKLYRKLHPKE